MDFRDVKEFIKDTIGYAIFIAIIFLIAIYVVGLQQVVGDSMNPNFSNGDVLILDKLTYRFKEPKRGDVIAFYYEDSKFLIKRIIGLPGDKIEFIDNTLYINDKEYKEEYLEGNYTDDWDLSILEVDKIPEGKYLALGDNRENSLDSRNPKVGLVDKEKIYGMVRIRFWPIKEAKFYK